MVKDVKEVNWGANADRFDFMGFHVNWLAAGRCFCG